MKLNNKGFAISSILYLILVMAIILISIILAVLSGRKLVLDKLKAEVYNDIYSEICTLKSGEPKAIGSKYECEVKEGVKYNFYVLSQEEDGTTNLILDRNINSDGTLATEGLIQAHAKNGVYNLVAWVSKEDYNDDTNYGEYGKNNKGPITAMNFLYNATKDWTNVPNIQMNYEDEGNKAESHGYGKIVTTNNVTKITKKDGSTVIVLTDKEGYTNLKARLPYKSEVTGTGKCSTFYGSCPLYLVNYLRGSSYVKGEGLQNISGIGGYWTLSTLFGATYYSAYVNHHGLIINGDVSGRENNNGVRPVINLKL